MTGRLPRLTVVGIRKAFGPTLALSGVNLDVAPGEVHALVGENGAGKSTLMKVLSGALLPDAGHVEIDGQPFAPSSPLDAAAAGVAMVYQELSLVPHLNARDNILLGRERVGPAGFIRPGDSTRHAREALASIGHPNIDLHVPVGRLPVAVQQVIEIARACSHPRTRVLILDEPTSSLAAHDVARLFSLITRLKERGVSVIYISHVLEEVQQIADRFTVLRDGATTATGLVADVSPAAIVSLMAGRAVDTLFPRSPRSAGTTRLTVEGLAGREKPESASLELRAGEVIGIAGLMGAGRTEFLRCIFGLDPVARGSVRVAAAVGGTVIESGRHAATATPWQRLRQSVGLLSEDRKREGLAVGLSVADNLTLSHLSGLGPRGFVVRRRQHEAAARWIRQLGIRTSGPDCAVQDLSGGNQQKVALARLLHHDAEVLLLDEPTRGIDVTSKAQIYTLIDQLALSGKAVLMVSSYLPELLGICDRVAVMRRGRLGPARPVTDLTEHTLLMEAMGQS